MFLMNIFVFYMYLSRVYVSDLSDLPVSMGNLYVNFSFACAISISLLLLLLQDLAERILRQRMGASLFSLVVREIVVPSRYWACGVLM